MSFLTYLGVNTDDDDEAPTAPDAYPRASPDSDFLNANGVHGLMCARIPRARARFSEQVQVILMSNDYREFRDYFKQRVLDTRLALSWPIPFQSGRREQAEDFLRAVNLKRLYHPSYVRMDVFAGEDVPTLCVVCKQRVQEMRTSLGGCRHTLHMRCAAWACFFFGREKCPGGAYVEFCQPCSDHGKYLGEAMPQIIARIEPMAPPHWIPFRREPVV